MSPPYTDQSCSLVVDTADAPAERAATTSDFSSSRPLAIRG